MDRNDYYGGKSTSVTPLKSLFSYFNVSGDTEKFGTGKEWNVEYIPPKCSDVEWQPCSTADSYWCLKILEFKDNPTRKRHVYQNGGIHKVPCDEAEALSSNLMSLFEKRRFRKLLVWVMNVRSDDPATWKDVYQPPKDIAKDSVMHAFEHFEINEDTQVVRAICLLNHPIPGVQNVTSCQVIIPQKESKRHHDIYISCVSHPHMVCPEKFYVVLVATTVETENPHDELKPGLDLLGPIEQLFYSVEDLFEPVDDGRSSKIFISSSYDASTHFESTCEDVLNLYERITGQPFDFSKVSEKMNKWKEEA
ncbi:Rab GDP dissociation inhibitor beta [Fasciola gigantica]|uniref:Rab GDP dissociation inhibitor beta n=1 Tax=Fasciola gigantica TaxID=46835 RepID=A0A504YD60_FASGI|nr:Rab GDP dissociation inhibitor beta [Fasciola gigantica]